MTLSIITPSYNMLEYLKRCHASIVDQANVSLEHIIVDNNSTDGTVEWLKEQNIKCIIENDNGMYDAVNKGINIASGDIIAYLNCDEQYLPGALETVKKVFENNSDVDFVHGNMLTVNSDGTLNAFKKSHKLRKNFILGTSLYAYSCATFFRKKIFDLEYLFSSEYKSIGDEEFVLRLLDNGFKSKYVNEYLSVFFLTGSNLSQYSISGLERAELKKQLLFKTYKRRYYLFLKIISKVFYKSYFQKFPLIYSIYLNSTSKRTMLEAIKGSSRSKW